MYISVFTDELKQEVTRILPTFAQWGMEYVDFRGLIHGAPIERQSDEQLRALKAQLDSLGLKTGVIQSSLCKKHLPEADVVKVEMEKLEGSLIATTNLTGNLDKAFERRFLYKIKFNKPEIGPKTKIWMYMIPELSEQQARELAEGYSFSGGQIENISRKKVIKSFLWLSSRQ